MREGLIQVTEFLQLCLSPLTGSTSSRDTLSHCGTTLLLLSPSTSNCPFFMSLVAEAGTGMGPPVPCTAADG